MTDDKILRARLSDFTAFVMDSFHDGHADDAQTPEDFIVYCAEAYREICAEEVEDEKETENEVKPESTELLTSGDERSNKLPD